MMKTRTGEKKVIRLIMPVDLHQRMSKAAQADLRSVTAEINYACEMFLSTRYAPAKHLVDSKVDYETA